MKLLIFVFVLLLYNYSLCTSTGYYNVDSESWDLQIKLTDSYESITEKDFFILDNNNEIFKNSKPININISRNLLKINFNLIMEGVYYNSYDLVRNEYLYDGKCSTANKRICCPKKKWYPDVLISHGLEQNSTQYLVYSIQLVSEASYKYSIDINNELIEFSTDQFHNENFTISPIYSNIENDFSKYQEIANTYFLVVPDELDKEPFFTNKVYFGDSINHIGISKNSFSAIPESNLCNEPGYGVKIGSSNNIYDQFSSFRQITIPNIFSTCSLQNLNQDILNNPQLSITCLNNENLSNSQLLISLNSTKFPIFKSNIDIEILHSGIYPFLTKSNILYFDIQNRFVDNININIKTKMCCESIDDCSNLQYQNEASSSLENGESKRIFFSILTNTQLNDNGFCIYNIYSNEHFIQDLRVNFNSSNYLPPASAIVSDSNNLEIDNLQQSATCPSPKLSGVKNGVEYCIEPCTIDQQFFKSLVLCVPVICSEKYGSGKIYYNPNTGLCTNVIQCPDGYEPISNTCQQIKNTTSSSSEEVDCYDYESCKGIIDNLPNDKENYTIDPTTRDTPSFNKHIPRLILSAIIIIPILIASLIIYFSCVRRPLKKMLKKRRKAKKRAKKRKIREMRKQYKKNKRKVSQRESRERMMIPSSKNSGNRCE